VISSRKIETITIIDQEDHFLIEIKNKIKRGERFFNLSPCRIPAIYASYC